MYPNQPEGQQPYQPEPAPQPYQPPQQPYSGYPQQPQQPTQPSQQTYQPFPQQPQPYVNPQQSPLDYLNQIAPQGPPKKQMFKGVRGLIALGLVAVVIVSILGIVLSAVNGQQRGPAQQMGARLVSTSEIVTDSQQKLSSSELRSLNSSLRLILNNASRDSAAPLALIDVNVEKIDGNVKASEEARATEISNRLEDARLNAIYDRTYAREMSYEVATLMTLLQQVYNQTSSASLQTFLETTYKNLEPIQKGLASYNEAA